MVNSRLSAGQSQCACDALNRETARLGSSAATGRRDGRNGSRESLMRMQPMVIGHHYMASAGQYLATEAAHAILRAGGNAIDAGVAGGIALGGSP